MAETVQIVVEGVDKASKPFGDVAKSLLHVGDAAQRARSPLDLLGGLIKGTLVAGSVAAAAGIAGLTASLVSCISAATEAEEAQAGLTAVLKSTHGAAGMTSEELNNLATSLSKVTKFEDDTIVQGEAMLLTFTNIGKKVFPKATESMLDLAEKMHTGPEQAAIQLGKALNDPIEGVSALRRVGVQLSQQQEDQIKSLLGSGEALASMGKDAAKASADLDNLQNDLTVARMRLGEMEASGKASASSLTAQRFAIQELEGKIAAASGTVATFTQAQADAATGLSRTEAMAKAQEIILGELATEFGGTAKAAGQTFAGQMIILGNAIGNVKEEIGGAFLPILRQFIVDNGPRMVELIENIGARLKSVLVPAVQTATVIATQFLIYLSENWNGRLVTMQQVSARIWDSLPVPVKLAIGKIWERIQVFELQIEGWLYRSFGVTRKDIVAWFEGMKTTSVKNINEISVAISTFRRETLDPLLSTIGGIIKGKNDIGDALRILFGGGLSDAEWAKYERWGQQILQTMRDIVEIAKDVDTWLGRRGIRLPNQVIEPEAGPHGGGGGSAFGFAAGTSYAPGGLSLVGERGPELVDLPRGARVYPAGPTAGLLGGAIDYNRLATVLASQPIVVQLDGERVATVVRARLQGRGAGGMGW